jgi:16S rRNA processing protein RimM
VGRIGKAHGLRGEVVVSLTTSETSRVSPGSTLLADGRPLVVQSSRPHQTKWVTAFEGITSREAAEALRGTVLFAEGVVDDDPEALWVHELIGARVVDADDVERGVVESVLANPASDLLVLDNGALVPLRFVTGWRSRPEVIEIDPPVGLFED